MSLFAGCNGTRTHGMVIDDVYANPPSGESMRAMAERKLLEYRDLVPGARVWIRQTRAGFEIRTSSRKLRDQVLERETHI